MGVDARVWSAVVPTEEQLAELRSLLEPLDDYRTLDGDVVSVGRIFVEDLSSPGRPWDGTPAVEWASLFRYWAPGVGRYHGSWPYVAQGIDAFRKVFGNVYYHSDITDFVNGPFTPEQQAEYQTIWEWENGS